MKPVRSSSSKLLASVAAAFDELCATLWMYDLEGGREATLRRRRKDRIREQAVAKTVEKAKKSESEAAAFPVFLVVLIACFLALVFGAVLLAKYS